MNVTPPTDVPLPEVRGGVTAVLERLRGGRRLRIEEVGHAAFGVGLTHLQKGVDFPPSLILAGEEGRPRGRTDRRIHVEILQLHPLRCELVDVRRFHVRIAEAARVGVAHIVDEEDHDIGREVGRAFGVDRQEEEGRENGPAEQHTHGGQCFKTSLRVQ